MYDDDNDDGGDDNKYSIAAFRGTTTHGDKVNLSSMNKSPLVQYTWTQTGV